MKIRYLVGGEVYLRFVILSLVIMIKFILYAVVV